VVFHAFLKVEKGLKKTTFLGKFRVPAPNPNRGRSKWSLTPKEFDQRIKSRQKGG